MFLSTVIPLPSQFSYKCVQLVLKGAHERAFINYQSKGQEKYIFQEDCHVPGIVQNAGDTEMDTI